MTPTPRWIPLLFGTIMILMAAIILAAFFGFIPVEGGQWLAPPVIIFSLALCLFFGGLAMYIPEHAPAVLRSGIFFAALACLATVCNWSAFAPGVTYTSSTSVGPVTVSGQDPVGGRIAFGLAALAVDAFIVSVVVGWVRTRNKRNN